MKVLLTGANGFIASAIIESLLATGVEIIACARSNKNLPSSPSVVFQHADFKQLCTKSDWLPLLNSVDAVINCAGILREQQTGDFELIHNEVPQALVEACLECGVKKFIQISALGEAEDADFIASKYRFDQYLLASSLSSVVIRPSVVLTLRGSYGGTSLLRALAAWPFVIFLPGEGEQRIQPILLEDLAAIVSQVLLTEGANDKITYAVGPETLSFRRYLLLLRGWLKLPPARIIHIPQGVINLAVGIGQYLSVGPLNKTIHTMLERGNVGPDGAYSELIAATSYTPRSVTRALQESASFVQDRWHARLYLLTPVIWFVLIIVWLLSGIAGFLAQPQDYQSILGQLYVPDDYQWPLVLATSILDIVLAIGLLFRYKIRFVLYLMLLAVLGYTLLLGCFAPSLWLEPLGSLLKNVPIMALLCVYLVLEDSR